jgi:hypothetical protein
MATSQNGWTVNPRNRTDLTVNGVDFGDVRSGDVFTVLQYVATRFAAEVERLISGQCGAYNPRKIEDSNVWSNHASATAIDCNWQRHPRGKSGTFARSQVAKIRELLTYCDGVVRWGGDFATTVDEMHFEIHGNSADVTALADKIRGDDMAMTEAEMRKLAGYIGDAVADKLLHADVIPYTNAAGVQDTWQLATAIGYMTGKSRDIAANTAPPRRRSPASDGAVARVVRAPRPRVDHRGKFLDGRGVRVGFVVAARFPERAVTGLPVVRIPVRAGRLELLARFHRTVGPAIALRGEPPVVLEQLAAGRKGEVGLC